MRNQKGKFHGKRVRIKPEFKRVVHSMDYEHWDLLPGKRGIAIYQPGRGEYLVFCDDDRLNTHRDSHIPRKVGLAHINRHASRYIRPEFLISDKREIKNGDLF